MTYSDPLLAKNWPLQRTPTTKSAPQAGPFVTLELKVAGGKQEVKEELES